MIMTIMKRRMIDDNEEIDYRFELSQYVIIIDLVVEIPNGDIPVRYEGKYAYPMVNQNIDEEDIGNLPILGEVIQINSYNLRNPRVDLTLMLGEKDEFLSLKPLRKQKVDFEYNEGEGLVRGHMSLTLLKYNLGDYKSHDRIIIEETKIRNDETGEMEKSEKEKLRVKYHSKDSVSVGYGIYNIHQVSSDCRFAIIEASEIGGDDFVRTYFPVSMDEPNIQEMTFSYEGIPYLTVTKIYYQKEPKND